MGRIWPAGGVVDRPGIDSKTVLKKSQFKVLKYSYYQNIAFIYNSHLMNRRQSKFSNVGKLSLVLESTNSDQKISIKYIGLEGVFHSQKQGKMEKFSYRVHGNNPNQAELSSQVVKNIS